MKIKKRTTSDRNLVALLVWIASIRIRKMDVTASFVHYAANCIPSFADDVRVISVRYIHFHRHASSFCIQMLHDQGFGQDYAFF